MAGQKGRSGGWGGVRPGAGPPRRVIHFQMPPEVIKQLEEVAAFHHTSVEQVAYEFILSALSDWQDEHDARAPS